MCVSCAECIRFRFALLFSVNRMQDPGKRETYKKGKMAFRVPCVVTQIVLNESLILDSDPIHIKSNTTGISPPKRRKAEKAEKKALRVLKVTQYRVGSLILDPYPFSEKLERNRHSTTEKPKKRRVLYCVW